VPAQIVSQVPTIQCFFYYSVFFLNTLFDRRVPPLCSWCMVPSLYLCFVSSGWPKVPSVCVRVITLFKEPCDSYYYRLRTDHKSDFEVRANCNRTTYENLDYFNPMSVDKFYILWRFAQFAEDTGSSKLWDKFLLSF
jgi:hypothetical protein